MNSFVLMMILAWWGAVALKIAGLIQTSWFVILLPLIISAAVWVTIGMVVLGSLGVESVVYVVGRKLKNKDKETK